MNNLAWQAYIRQCRWLAFRAFMFRAWPWIALIVASFAMNWK